MGLFNNRAGLLGPMQIDGGTPQLPTQRGGMFDWFQDDPGAISATDGSGGRGPRTAQQKQSLLFGGISDAIDNLQGRGGNTTEELSKQYAADYTKQKALQRRTAVNQAIAVLMEKGDYTGAKKLILTADPEDVSHIHDAITLTQPTTIAYGDGQNLFSKDPLSGALTPTLKIPEKNNPNAAFNADGTPNQPYQDYQVSLARARAKATADFRAPAKPGKSNGVISLPHPGSQY